MRRGDVFHQRFEDRRDVLARLFELPACGSRATRGIEHREIQRLIIRAEFDEQVEDHVEHFVGAGVLTVDLVDHDDRAQLMLKRLLEHEPRLRHGPFGSIDEQEDAVRHRQHALDLAAEVRVAGGVDQVDLDDLLGDRVGVVDGDVLGQNGDAALALQRVAVEHRVLNLVIAEVAALPEQGIDQRRLSMVDVGDNRDVSNVITHGVHIVGCTLLKEKRGKIRPDRTIYNGFECKRFVKSPTN